MMFTTAECFCWTGCEKTFAENVDQTKHKNCVTKTSLHFIFRILVSLLKDFQHKKVTIELRYIYI